MKDKSEPIHQKDKRLQVLVRMWRKGNPCALLVGMPTGSTTVELHGGSSKNKKNRTPRVSWPIIHALASLRATYILL